MIEKIDGNRIQDLFEKPASKQVNPADATVGSSADASLQVNYAELIEKAMQVPQEDDKAIQQAKEILLSGQLESPENIRAAAENILKFGV
jgi:hypothetical protein